MEFAKWHFRRFALNKLVFFILFSFISLPSQSKCLLGPEFIDSAITFSKSLRSVKSFIVHSGHSDVPPFSGAATSFTLTGKFTALRLEPSAPYKSEKKAFIFAVDLPTEKFYSYYTNGVSAPHESLIEGKISDQNCSIFFEVSETEELEVKIQGEGNMEVISRVRSNSDKKFALNQRFEFSSKAHAN
ncbi:MAG TPA: hypothetical protein DEO86_04495 [Colwellia sp.]|nr:hypothetical protein [Colwellia sp.]